MALLPCRPGTSILPQCSVFGWCFFFFKNAWSIFSFIRHFEGFGGLESLDFPTESLWRVSEVSNTVMTAQSSDLGGEHLLWLCSSVCLIPPVTRAHWERGERLDGWEWDDAFVNGQREQPVMIPCHQTSVLGDISGFDVLLTSRLTPVFGWLPTSLSASCFEADNGKRSYSDLCNSCRARCYCLFFILFVLVACCQETGEWKWGKIEKIETVKVSS